MITLALRSKQTSITAQTMRWPCKLFSAETSQFKQPSPRRRSLPKYSADRERSDRPLVTYVKRESGLRYGSAPYPEQPRRGRHRGRFLSSLSPEDRGYRNGRFRPLHSDPWGEVPSGVNGSLNVPAR
jgi:hypothetical protein